MERNRKIIAITAAVMVLGLLAATGLIFLVRWQSRTKVEISGVVLRNDDDPKKQVPVQNAEIVASDGKVSTTTKSDANGYFQIKFASLWHTRETVSLAFRHPEYEPLQLAGISNGQICVARLTPEIELTNTVMGKGVVSIANVRVRYSLKSLNPVNVGSAAPVFEAWNKGGVPCGHSPNCSPDGKWKATLNQQVFDAGQGNEFRDARISCIAGPCPFTKLEGDMVQTGRELKVAVLNWSDTATFLLEAEVVRTQMNNIVRLMYPVIFGTAMNFTLPAESEGAAIEAELNGTEIVFPLGPRLQLSWGTCTATQGTDNTKQFRCELKPGYVFKDQMIQLAKLSRRGRSRLQDAAVEIE